MYVKGSGDVTNVDTSLRNIRGLKTRYAAENTRDL